MYTEHFGLDDKPFSLIPAADSVYFSPEHRAAFNMLEFGLHESVGITLITGEVGSGKTTLVRHLLRRVDYDALTIGLISTTHRAFGSLLKWIVNAFRLETPSNDEGALLQVIQDFLLQEYAAGRRTVVIIDEAQNTDVADLESLRLLTNINADGQQLLQIVVVGQPELLQKFQDPRMSQLAQRVSAEYNLGPLSTIETMSYVHYRLGKVGGRQDIFDTAALLAVYYYSGGLPRIINTLCDGALVFAYGQNQREVSLETMLEVVKSKQIGGIHRPGIDTTPDREAVRADMKRIRGVDMLDLVG
jgi:type II secretory pathway predicted ATPase ExeA